MLTTWVVIPLVESVESGILTLEVPSVPIVTFEPLGAFKFGPLPSVETPSVTAPSALIFVVRNALLLSNSFEILSEASLFMFKSIPLGKSTVVEVMISSPELLSTVFTELDAVPSRFIATPKVVVNELVPEINWRFFEPSLAVSTLSKVISSGYLGSIPPLTTASTPWTGSIVIEVEPVSYTHLTLPTKA